jgi:hypothetical protein
LVRLRGTRPARSVRSFLRLSLILVAEGRSISVRSTAVYILRWD